MDKLKLMKTMKLAIKQLREQKALTQTEVANALGMTLGNYQKYEYGRIRTYPHEVLEKFCNLFECDPNELFSFPRKQTEQNVQDERAEQAA